MLRSCFPGIIYASTLDDGSACQERLEAALSNVLSTSEDAETAKTLWIMTYTTRGPPAINSSFYSYTYNSTHPVMCFPDRKHDIAFDDSVLDSVKAAWEAVLGEKSAEYDFLRFEERKSTNEDD